MLPKSDFDRAKLLALISGGGALVTSGLLHSFGLGTDASNNILSIVGFISAFSALVANVYKNPSPPDGSVTAVIPKGSVPVVAAAPGTDRLSVAQVDGTISGASSPPPKPGPPQAAKGQP